jgi:hypothetical protein
MSVGVIELAKGVDDTGHAAKLREQFSIKLEEDEGLRQDHADNLAEAIDLLEDRYPEIMGLAKGEAADFARRRKGKPAAKKKAPATKTKSSSSSSRRPAKGKATSGKAAAGKAQSAGRKLTGAGRGRSTSPRIRRGARRAWRDTGIPGATSSTTSTVLSLLGLTVGASLLYMLLTNAESAGRGRSAIAHIAGGTATAVEGLIAPRDPFAGRAAAAAAGTKGPIGASLPSTPPGGRRRRPGARKSPFPSERRPA